MLTSWPPGYPFGNEASEDVIRVKRGLGGRAWSEPISVLMRRGARELPPHARLLSLSLSRPLALPSPPARGRSEKVAVCELGRRPSPEADPARPRSGSSGRRNCEETNVCCSLRPPACRLPRQPDPRRGSSTRSKRTSGQQRGARAAAREGVEACRGSRPCKFNLC